MRDFRDPPVDRDPIERWAVMADFVVLGGCQSTNLTILSQNTLVEAGTYVQSWAATVVICYA